MNIRIKLTLLILIWIILSPSMLGQGLDVDKMLGNFDAYMAKVLKEWNAPGIGVGIVVKDKLVFARGYGYRDYDKKLPVTPGTLFQIASNTKLFTAVAVGMLVEEGKLDWDKPIRRFVPTIQFYNEDLNNSVSIRDMLAHRTGISRHDFIWYKSDFSRQELFDRLKYLEPSQSLRQGFLYNNMMYAAAGYVVQYIAHQTWEEFVSDRILIPLGMRNTTFSVGEMKQRLDFSVPYKEKRDTTILVQIPHYEEQAGVGPAGSIISNIEDMSRWLIALMNNGTFGRKQVLPERVVASTLSPSIAMPNTLLETRGYAELLNAVYGMGRWTASYRGRFVAYHGGAIGGIYSHVSCMPREGIGVIVFSTGAHTGPLPDIVTYNVYERLLGMEQTPWFERLLKDRLAAKAGAREARTKAGGDRVPNTKPSHNLEDYTGTFEHPAYGLLTVSQKGDGLQMDIHKIVLPLHHFHYERFDTPNDELYGLWSLNYFTNPQGEVDRIVISLDESEVSFIRKADASLSDSKTLNQYAGKYQTAGGSVFDVVLKTDNFLYLVFPGQPTYQLVPYKARKFRIKDLADITFEFVIENGKVTLLKQRDPSGEYQFRRK